MTQRLPASQSDNQRLDWGKLDAGYRKILPHMGVNSLTQDPQEFEQNFRALTEKWRAAGGLS